MALRPKVILQPVTFRKKHHIAILANNNHNIDEIVREFENAEWSTGYRYWHLPCSIANFDALKKKLGKIAKVDITAFKQFDFNITDPNSKATKKKVKVSKPTSHQRQYISDFKEYYLSLGTSESTVKIYGSLLNVFWGYFNTLKEEDLRKHHIDTFITDYIVRNDFSKNYKRLMNNTLNRYLSYIKIEKRKRA